jgi:N-formylglutamate amidohydrolase
VTPRTVGAGQTGQIGQVSLLDCQKQHLCTDCGHKYLDGIEPSQGLPYSLQVAGGGTVVSTNDGPIKEMHILPHCGTELPSDLLAELSEDQLPALAKLVHQNADIGTGAIYRALVDKIVTGEYKGVVVAGFHVSRLLLDANRATEQEQVPPKPYVGTADVYRDYLRRHGAELRRQALLPWLEAVDAILREMGEDGVVYHHHTYDVFSMSPRPWDRGLTPERPAFQLVWTRPAIDPAGDDGTLLQDHGLLPLRDVENVRDRINEFLRTEMGLPEGGGSIDYPMFLPVVPFTGTRKGDPVGMPRHVMYDLRKDILVTEDQIQSWVKRAPWRLEVGGNPFN